jgi:glycosyltransferase involved in cell wall biosynthesis
MKDLKSDLNSPLVTILVVSFNSSEFIIETLESARHQTYRNIELVISDDNSNDNTVDICRKWLKENSHFFMNTELITSNINTGIPANFNRGIKKASGFWLKGIAGDDILANNCIEKLLEYISGKEDEVSIISSDMIKFSGKTIKSGIIEKNIFTWFCSIESTALEQYQMLLRSNRVFASTVLIKRELLDLTNGYDEQFRLMEDWPLWLKLTQLGYKIFHLGEALVYYRFHENNLSQTSSDTYIYNPIYKIDLGFREKVLAPQLPFIERWGLKYRICGIKICFRLGNNKNNFFAKSVYLFFENTNPLRIFIYLHKILLIKYVNIKYF